MRQHGDGDLLHVVGQDVVAPRERGVGTGGPQEVQARPRRGAEPQGRARAGRVGEVDDVLLDAREACTSRTASTIADTVAASVTGSRSSSGDAPPWVPSMSSSARADG